MSSSIRFASSAASKQSSASIYSRPQKKQKMSITQTYFLAHSARGKLSKEAARSDHDLRLLVGHANLLDSLMIDLASAEREQESWFNKSVSGAKASEEEMPSHEWAETVIEEPEADWEAEDADSTDEESQYDEDEDTKRTSSAVITATEIDQEEDDEEMYGELALTRTPSRHTPPELSADSDSDSEDEHMPPSPPQPTFNSFTEKERQAIATTSFYDKKEAALTATEQETFTQEGFYLPSRQQPTMIAAF
jgi:hypothetical protein